MLTLKTNGEAILKVENVNERVQVDEGCILLSMQVIGTAEFGENSIDEIKTVLELNEEHLGTLELYTEDNKKAYTFTGYRTIRRLEKMYDDETGEPRITLILIKD